jgi:hypothetical protein
MTLQEEADPAGSLAPESPGESSFPGEEADPNPPGRSSRARPGYPRTPTPARGEPLRRGCT